VELFVGIWLAIAIAGASAITLAGRPRIPCKACKRGVLTIGRDFAYHCSQCDAVYVRDRGSLRPR